MPFGFHNKILRVDLTEGRTWVEEPGELVYRKYFGGSTLSLYYLLKELPKGTDPLGPENVLIFAPSVITGTQIAGDSAVGEGDKLFDEPRRAGIGTRAAGRRTQTGFPA